MKPEMRHKLAQLPFEEKIRKVSKLIRLSRKVKRHEVRGSLKDSQDRRTRDEAGALG